MSDLTATNIDVLRLLNRYRFLTNPQLLRLDLVHDNTSIYRILSRFGDGNRPYIGKKDFGFIAGVGRLHRIYYLQKRGAQLLAEALHLDEDEVSYQKIKPPRHGSAARGRARSSWHPGPDRAAPVRKSA
jgi:hypothetical protein